MHRPAAASPRDHARRPRESTHSPAAPRSSSRAAARDCRCRSASARSRSRPASCAPASGRSIDIAVCSADSCRSVLKILNSASSWPKAVPVSGIVRKAVTVEIVAVDQPQQHFVEPRAIVGEVGLHAHGAALKRHDRHQHRRIHLRRDEFLRGRERAHRVAAAHRRHVEIQNDQPVIAIPDVARRGGGNLGLNGCNRCGGCDRCNGCVGCEVGGRWGRGAGTRRTRSAAARHLR